MAQKTEIYRCNRCGNLVEVMYGGIGALACCGQAMKLLVENTTDALKEKHVPVVEKMDDRIKVTVGSVAHPMEEKHYIKWIELLAGDKTYRQYLLPDNPPEAVFPVSDWPVSVREYCNLHGLWKA